MNKRVAAILCIIVLGLGLSGCTKCGWLWEQGPRACRADAPR